MKSRLKSANRVADDVVSVAEQAKDAAMLARQEAAACRAKSEVDRKAREAKEEEVCLLKVWLEEHKKSVRHLH